MLGEIVRAIRTADPTARICVRCHKPPEIPGVEPFIAELFGQTGKIRALWTFVYRVARMMGSVDCLVIGGGTLFLDRGKHNKSMFLLWFAVVLATVRGVRIAMTGVGIDVLTHPTSLFYLKWILRHCDAVRLRDGFSVTVGRYLAPQSNIKRSADIVFGLNSLQNYTVAQNCSDHSVLISLTDYFRTIDPSDERREAFIGCAKRTIRQIVELYPNHRICMAAFQKRMGDHDYELLSEIQEQFKGEDRILHRLHVAYLQHAGDIVNAYSSARFVIAMRFHALVLSALFERPFIGIDMEMKLREISAEFDMPCIGVHEFADSGISEGTLAAMTTQRIENRKLLRQQELVRANFDWLVAR